MTRFGIIEALRGHIDLRIRAEAKNTAEALDVIARQSVDLVITDISMPGRNGLELVKDALALKPQLKVLICSMHDELIYGERALRAGARGFIMKDEGGPALLQAIRTVLQGGTFVSPRLASRRSEAEAGPVNSPPAARVSRLSDRELEIFTLIGQGRRTSEIADLLHLSIKTVDTHRANMREKLDLPNGSALTFYATHWVADKY